MNYNQIETKVINVIAHKIGIETSVINPSSLLENDLMLDEIDLEELEQALEKEFLVPVNITDRNFPDTVKDVVDHVSKKMR